MASHLALSRDSRGRFKASLPEPPQFDPVPAPPPPPPPDPLRFPTIQHPRWRLRVFDRRWPWRATRGEALRDAVASRNARRDLDDRCVYLDAVANIQRDPPFCVDRWRMQRRRAAEAEAARCGG